MVKSEEQKQHEKIIVELKGRAVKFRKSNTTFWAKANLQLKNKENSALVTQSIGT